MIRVALGEYDTGWHDPATSLDRAAALVRDNAARGADLVVLPEMCPTGFTMEPEAWAEPVDGPSVGRLQEIAREARVHLLAGVATREGEGYFNSAFLIDPAGEITAHYRKQRLFVYSEEQRHYLPGDGPVVARVGDVRLGIFICFDLRFPEIFRGVALQVDAMAVIASWPAARRLHWDTLNRARAIENQCYLIAVNRTGEGGGLSYDGGSAAYDAWGERLGGGGDIVELDPLRVAEIREKYPFLDIG